MNTASVEVIEANQPDRATRRRRGKTDALDAEAAARAVLSGRATAKAKAGNGSVEMLPLFKLAKTSALKARTQAINHLKAVLVSADPQLRDSVKGLSTAKTVRHCAHLPIEASSGKNQRHRLNRGGDRQANCALHTIALIRVRWDPRTRDYMERRLAEGKTRRETIRCLKRYIIREIYQLLRSTPTSGATT